VADTVLVYVGTYTDPIAHVPDSTGEGIYLYRLDLSDGSLTWLDTTAGIVNPSFLTFGPDRSTLYAVSELNERGGHVASLAIDPENFTLRLMNQQPAHGQAACYLVVDSTGQYVLTANFMDGSACVYPIREDGSLEDASHRIEHQGSGPNPRQNRAHIHCVTFDRAGRYVFLSDFGIDKLVGYALDLNEGRLVPHNETAIQPGGGPRHFVFRSDGRFGYSLQELDGTVVVFSYDQEKGELHPIQTVSTLPEGFKGKNTTSTLHIHPSFRFLYAANRGHNSIVIYEVDEKEGTLDIVGWEASGGIRPRDFNIEPSGKYLLVGHQHSDNIVTFYIDPDTGELLAVRESEVPTPACIQFLEE
jgi:6-phosphogluconolactonase